MKVFISWSGPQSNYIALALRDWLGNVIQNLTPWMSEVDVDAGDRWGERLWRELQDSQFGVVCLTAENLQAPWLHYEAGALAKAVDRRVCPYLYKIKPTMVQGPLSHHQAKQVDKQGTRKLLHSINTASLNLTQRGLPSEQFNKTFDTWWPQLEEKLSAVPPSTTAPPPRRETREIVEEILEIVRDQKRVRAQARQFSFGDYPSRQFSFGDYPYRRKGSLHGISTTVSESEGTLSVGRKFEEGEITETPQGEKPPSK